MIRIIAGRWRGKILKTPDHQGVRPTTDRMRERLFSILQHPRYPAIARARVADLFAGSGALGAEALSRGAVHLTTVEQDPRTARILKQNLASLDGAETQIIQGDATCLEAAPAPFDIIFMDPPYSRGLVDKAIAAVMAANWLAPGGVIAAEAHKKDAITLPPALDIVDTRIQGIQKLMLIQYAEES